MMSKGIGAFACTMASVVLLAACEQRAEVEKLLPHEPVVVYASYKDRTYLPALLDAYTKETGTIIIVRHGIAPAIVNDVIENEIMPPADVLFTPSVAGAWRAAEKGALRPLRSTAIDERLPAWLRDPDEYWVAFSYQSAVLAYNVDAVELAELTSYASLADSEFRGRVCLSSSSNPLNRAVLAMLIDSIGVRPAEIAVRGWVANLALPIFDSEVDLLAAIQSGECGLGIASSTAVASAGDLNVSAHTPAAATVDIEAIAVARHARNPDGAAALIEWMSTKDVQSGHSAELLFYPANPQASHARVLDAAGRDNVGSKNVVLVAWHYEEAARLAERARYR